jgi:NRPS condensation-like uncharacterized protein
MGRRLGYFESAAAFSNDRTIFNFVSVLVLKNAPAPEMLERALKLLQVRHPSLRVKIHRQNGGYQFDESDVQQIRLKTEARVDDQSWMAVAEEALNTRLDWHTGPLLAVTYVYSPSSAVSEVVFNFHHTIIDAQSAVAFFDEFLGLCARLMGGEGIAPGEESAFPQAVESHFPPGYRGFGLKMRTAGFVLRTLGAELSFMLKRRKQRQAPIKDPSQCRILTLQLDRQQTQALERRVRAERVTLNSALQAALLGAVWRHVYQGLPGMLKFMFFQNLRPQLQPPVPETRLGSYIAMLQGFARLQAEQDFWELARAINQTIHQVARSGDKFYAVAFSYRLMRMLFQTRMMRMATTALNYSGAITLAKRYGDIERLDVYGFVTNFELGPEYTAQAAIVDEQLQWNIVYLEGDMDANQAQLIADEIREQLLAAGE